MKVINIILDARVGGPQIRIATISKHLTEHGIEIVVVMPENDSERFKSILKQIDTRFVAVPLHKLSKHPIELLKWFIFFLPETIRLIRVFRRENPQVIHCTGSWQWKGIIAALFTGAKIVWHLNDTHMPGIINNVFKFLKRLAHGFIVEGTKVKNYYLDSFRLRKTVSIIQAPVDTGIYDPLKNIPPDKQIMTKKGIKIVTVTNINILKGLEYFLETAVILNRKYDNLHFFIVGPAFDTQKEYIEKLTRQIEKDQLKNIHFYGESTNIPSILSATDIYVCSSIYEASPQSVWEAMAMEKAIVSTDVGAVPDFVKDGENGFVVPARSPAKMAEKIVRFIENPGLRKTCGGNARKTAVKDLDVKVSAAKHKEIYNKLCNDSDE